MGEPKGILRNAKTHDYSSLSAAEYDRKLVLENTKKNAQLSKESALEGERLREEIARKKRANAENVQFNPNNLEENDKLKASMTFTKIDEPKTPYQGPVDETNDYYRNDNEDDDGESFSLGEGEQDEEDEQEEEAERELEEKHKKFEEMRKKHYHNEVVHPLKAKKLLEEEEDLDE